MRLSTAALPECSAFTRGSQGLHLWAHSGQVLVWVKAILKGTEVCFPLEAPKVEQTIAGQVINCYLGWCACIYSQKCWCVSLLASRDKPTVSTEPLGTKELFLTALSLVTMPKTAAKGTGCTSNTTVAAWSVWNLFLYPNIFTSVLTYTATQICTGGDPLIKCTYQ